LIIIDGKGIVSGTKSIDDLGLKENSYGGAKRLEGFFIRNSILCT
jgi:hypothetical protein